MSRTDRGARRAASRPEVTPLEGRRLMTLGLAARSNVAALALAAAANRPSTASLIAPQVKMATAPPIAAGTASTAGITRMAVQSARGTVGATTTTTPRLASPVVVQATPTGATQSASRLAKPTVRLATATTSPVAQAQDTDKLSAPRVVMQVPAAQATPAASARVVVPTLQRAAVRSI